MRVGSFGLDPILPAPQPELEIYFSHTCQYVAMAVSRNSLLAANELEARRFETHV